MKNRSMWLLIITIVSTTTMTNAQVLNFETDTMKVSATNGTQFINGSTNVFGRIDKDFTKIKSKTMPMPEVGVKKFTLAKESTLKDAFESLGKNEMNAFTEHQLCLFAQKYENEIRQNNFSFLLLNTGSGYYVANIASYLNDSLKVDLHDLGEIGKYNQGKKNCIYTIVK